MSSRNHTKCIVCIFRFTISLSQLGINRKKKNILFCKKVSYFTQIYEKKDFGDNTFCLVIQETIKGKKDLCLPF